MGVEWSPDYKSERGGLRANPPYTLREWSDATIADLRAEVEQMDARLDEARRAASKALMMLKQAEKRGLPSCDDAARKALVNPDQHDSGCRVREAIALCQRVVDGHFRDTQAAIAEQNPTG